MACVFARGVADAPILAAMPGFSIAPDARVIHRPNSVQPFQGVCRKCGMTDSLNCSAPRRADCGGCRELSAAHARIRELTADCARLRQSGSWVTLQLERLQANIATAAFDLRDALLEPS